jgi:hypothetical protein
MGGGHYGEYSFGDPLAARGVPASHYSSDYPAGYDRTGYEVFPTAPRPLFETIGVAGHKRGGNPNSSFFSSGSGVKKSYGPPKPAKQAKRNDPPKTETRRSGGFPVPVKEDKNGKDEDEDGDNTRNDASFLFQKFKSPLELFEKCNGLGKFCI